MIEPPQSLRDAAVMLASQGFRVFKLMVNGKRPAVKDFPNIASNDPKRVRSMWTDPVSGDELYNNIGILTGGDFFVVDVDVKDGKKGLESLDQLIELGFDTDTKTARSPTGSLHYYLALPEGREARNTASKALGPGIDSRGHHGYVVAPPSITKDGIYEWYSEVEMTEAPEWMVQLVEKKEPPSSDTLPQIDEDEPAVQRAIEWLTRSAPEAIEGSGGNTQTYAVAAKLKDFGVTAPTATQLLIEHWNEHKAIPPWDPAELERVVDNAFQYGTSKPGISSAHADFWVLTQEEFDPPPEHWLKAAQFRPFDATLLPKRRWIVADFLVRTFAAGVVAPGGMGKTQFIANICLAIAAFTDAPIGMPVIEQTGVWYWNQEDDMDELRRRFAAAMQHHGVTWAQIGNRIRINSGVEKPLILVKRTADGRLVENKPAVDSIIGQIKAGRIGVFIFDPLVEFHEAEENDNVEMRTVMAVARRIAVEGDCAVLPVAHTRKPSGASADGFAGDMDALRGAGAQANVMRLMHTLFSMSIKDAKAYGVAADRRHLYVRLDTAKSNLSLTDGKPRWMRRVSVRLGGPDGETVGVLEPTNLTARQGAELDVAHAIATAVAMRLTRGAWHSAADVIAVLDEEKIEFVFGSNPTNRSRALTRKLDALGLDTKDGLVVETMTDAGKLACVNRKGNQGFQFKLSEGDDT